MAFDVAWRDPLQATHWDLPGHFIIASDDHPFTAGAPGGKEFVYDYWCRDDQAIENLKKQVKR